jgi:DNA-binding transcriptional ArsR family regulator
VVFRQLTIDFGSDEAVAAVDADHWPVIHTAAGSAKVAIQRATSSGSPRRQKYEHESSHDGDIKQPPRHPGIDELDIVSVLSALGNPIRMQIVSALANHGEHGWGELDVPVAKSTLSHDLKLLRDSGITYTRAEGSRCFVSLRRDDLDYRFPGLLDAVLDARPGAGQHRNASRTTAASNRGQTARRA